MFLHFYVSPSFNFASDTCFSVSFKVIICTHSECEEVVADIKFSLLIV